MKHESIIISEILDGVDRDAARRLIPAAVRSHRDKWIEALAGGITGDRAHAAAWAWLDRIGGNWLAVPCRDDSTEIIRSGFLWPEESDPTREEWTAYCVSVAAGLLDRVLDY